MFDGVLAGAEGRCNLKSCSGKSPSAGGTFSRVSVAPTLEPRARVVVLFDHGEIPVELDNGGEEEMEERGGWFGTSKLSEKSAGLTVNAGWARSSEEPEPSES